MTGFVLASALVGLHFLAALDAEGGAGVVPLPDAVGGSKSKPTVTAMISPSVGFEQQTELGPRFLGAYVPSISWRIPKYAEGSSLDPLLIHRLELLYKPVLQPRTTLQLQSQTTLGEIDFALTPAALGTTQTARSQVPVVQLFNESFSASLTRRLSHRLNGELMLPFTYQTPIGDDGSELGLVETTSAGGNAGLTYQVTRQDVVSIRAESMLAAFAESEQMSLQTQASWAHTLGALWQSNLSAGVGRIFTLRADETLDLPDAAQYFAVGGASLFHQSRHSSQTLQLNFDAHVDPFLQTIRPQATLSLGSTHQLAATTSLNLAISVVAPTAPDPILIGVVGEESTRAASETGLNGAASVQWGTDRLAYRAGVRGGFRGTHWSVEPFEAREELLLGFFGVNWGIVRPGR